MSVTFLSTKTIKLSTGEQAVCQPSTIHYYPPMPWLKDGPVAAVTTTTLVTDVASVANLMSEANAQLMGKLVIGAMASIISKLFVVLRLQLRRHRALIGARRHTHRGGTALQAARAKAEANVIRRNQDNLRPSRKCMR